MDRGVIKKKKAPRYTGIEPTPLGVVEVKVPLVLNQLMVRSRERKWRRAIRDSSTPQELRAAVARCFAVLERGEEDEWLSHYAPTHVRNLVDVLSGKHPVDVEEFIAALARFSESLIQVSYLGGVPQYIQDGDPEDPKFVGQFGEDLFDEEQVGFMNFALGGVVYVFSDRLDLQNP